MSQIVFDHDALRIVIWRNVLITHMVETLQLRHVAVFKRGYELVTQSNPDGVIAITMLHPNAGVADRPTRQAVTRIMDRTANTLKDQAVVLERSGLAITLLVSAVRAFNMLQKNRTLRAYQHLEDAARDLAPRVTPIGSAPTRPAELVDAVNAARPPRPLSARAAS